MDVNKAIEYTQIGKQIKLKRDSREISKLLREIDKSIERNALSGYSEMKFYASTDKYSNEVIAAAMKAVEQNGFKVVLLNDGVPLFGYEMYMISWSKEWLI